MKEKELEIKKNNYYGFVDLLKIIAIMLIINSHMDSIYPIKALATGGALGNALFFIASGFLIQGKNKNINFFMKSILKLYIPLFIITSFTGVNNDLSLWKQLIWPTNYWFIGAIIVFYILYSVLEKVKVFERIWVFLFVIILFYFSVYFLIIDTTHWVIEKEGLYDVESLFKLIYYFAIMIMGGYFRYKGEKTYPKRVLVVGCFSSVMIMYVSKYLMCINQLFMHLQCLSQICTFVFAVMFFLLLRQIDIRMMKNTEFLIRKVSMASLEIYIVQFTIIERLSKIEFPNSFLASLILIVVLGVVLSKIDQFVVLRLFTIGKWCLGRWKK